MDTDTRHALGVLGFVGSVLGAFYVGRETAPANYELEDCRLHLLGRDIDLLVLAEQQGYAE